LRNLRVVPDAGCDVTHDVAADHYGRRPKGASRMSYYRVFAETDCVPAFGGATWA
jgi:hypothetical protein